MNIIILFVALSADAKLITVPTPNVTAQDIDTEQIDAGLRKAGYAVTSFKCLPFKCEVTVPDASALKASDLAPIFNGAKTRSQQAAERRSALDELAAIEAKIDADTDTEADRRRALKLLLLLRRSTKG